MKLGGLALGLLLTAALTVSASAVSFDGNIDSHDDWYYTFVDGNDVAIENDLDIAVVAFDKNDDWFYMGVAVWNGPLNTSGGDNSLLGMTGIYAQFSNGIDHQLGVIWRDDVLQHVLLNGVQLDPADYAVSTPGMSPNVGEAGIEIAIKRSLLDLTTFSWVVQIDDFGLSFDDYAAGTAVGIPEPTALAILGLGSLAVLRRRR